MVQHGECFADQHGGYAELIDLDSGDVLAEAELPPATRPAAAVPGGLLLNAADFSDGAEGVVAQEGSHAVLTLTEDGVTDELTTGEVLAATDDHAAVIDCERYDPRAECRLDLVDLATAERTAVPAPADGTWKPVGVANTPTNTPPWAAVARNDRILVGLDGGPADDDSPHTRTQRLVVIDASDPEEPTASVLHELETAHLSAAWDHRGEHVVIADAMEPHLTAVDATDGSSFLLRDAIPADHYLLGMR